LAYFRNFYFLIAVVSSSELAISLINNLIFFLAIVIIFEQTGTELPVVEYLSGAAEISELI